MIQHPFTDCSRCRRLKLECKIESNFKRIGKRSRNAEMEREIIELRRQVANAQSNTTTPVAQQQHHLPVQSATKQDSSRTSPLGVYHKASPMSTDQCMGSQEAVASLLDLRSGFDGSGYMRNGSQIKRIEDVMILPERVSELFRM